MAAIRVIGLRGGFDDRVARPQAGGRCGRAGPDSGDGGQAGECITGAIGDAAGGPGAERRPGLQLREHPHDVGQRHGETDT